MGLPLRSILVVLGLGQLLAGCSSLGEDTPDHLDFALPSVLWTVSPTDPQWRVPAQPRKDNFVCAGPQALSTDCCAPPWDCQRYPSACAPDTNYCAPTFDVQVGQTVDVRQQLAPATELEAGVFARVVLLGLTATMDLSAGLPIRSAALFVGPQGLAESSEPAAVFFAPITLTSDPQPVEPTSAGRDAFSGFARDYQSPFTLLLSTHVVVPDDFQGAGRVQVTLQGQLRAFY